MSLFWHTTPSFLSRQSLESLEECNSSLTCNVINPWISQNMMQTDPDPVLNAVLACACSVRYLTTVSNWSGHPDFVTSFYNCSSLKFHPVKFWGYVTRSHPVTIPCSYLPVSPASLASSCKHALSHSLLESQLASWDSHHHSAWQECWLLEPELCLGAHKSTRVPYTLAGLQGLSQRRDLDSIVVNSTGPKGSNTMIFMLQTGLPR